MTLKLTVTAHYTLAQGRGCPKLSPAGCGVNYRGA
jgi:hypothetical protein